MPTALPNHSINYFAPLAPGAPCSVGQVMIPNKDVPDVADGTYFVVATTANRGDRGSEGIACSAWGGVPGSVGQVKLVQDGILPAEISGLAPGSKSFVRCSATGTVERIATASIDLSVDDIIGKAEADGRVHLFFGMPLSQIVTLIESSFTPGGTDTQVYYNNAGELATTSQITVSAGRATHVSPIVNGTPVYRSGGTDITSPVGRITTVSTSPVVLASRTPAIQDTEIVSILVRSRRNTSNTKRGSWPFRATVSRNGGNAVLDNLDTGTAFNLNAGTVAVTVSGTDLIVTVTPADTDSRDWDYELRVQGDT